MDPFVVLGVAPTMDLGPKELDERYLRLSRETHPDRHRSQSPGQQIAILEKSAKLNDAYRRLRDPWRRAEAIVNLRRPGVIEQASKKLCPIFLAEAMELSEEVSEAVPEQTNQLLARVETQVHAYLDRVRDGIAAEDWEGAATALHESRYFRKAAEDLKART